MAGIELFARHFRMTAQTRPPFLHLETLCLKTRLFVILWAVSALALSAGLPAQETEQPSQQPKTAPASQAILNSYEGQKVTAVEIAGRPNLDTSKLLPLMQQHAGEPFSRDKIDQSITALKSAGNFSEVQLQIEPEADGVRVLLIAEPAVWFGIFE